MQKWNACNCLQGHEEFDDEITLAGSGRVTPSGELLQQVSQAASPGNDAIAPATASGLAGPQQQTWSEQSDR